MGVARVAIIGRPNVGKSSIFNWLVGERISIVDSVAGVTRDRVSFLLDIGEDDIEESYVVPEFRSEVDEGKIFGEKSENILVSFETIEDKVLSVDNICRAVSSTWKCKKDAEHQKNSVCDNDREEKINNSTRYIELIDTGGIGIVDKDDLSKDVERQIQVAIDQSDLILFVVDVRDGLVPLDELVAERLRKVHVPILLVANKCDGETQEQDAREFYRLGWDVVPVSAKQKRGRVALMDAIEKALPVSFFLKYGDVYCKPEMKIAIVGRRNVGKSTFVNKLVHEERVIASPIPGTTRDCIDVRFEMNGKSFCMIDTPGFMRKKSFTNDLDYYALTRAKRSIRMADVVFMFFDSSLPIAKMDKQLVSLIESYEKPCIFVVNKWDKMLRFKIPTSHWVTYLRETFATMWHVPIAFVTGLTGKNVSKLIFHANSIYRQSKLRVPTNKLNKLIVAALNHTPPPLYHYHKPKIFYATQVAISPPTIVLFCNMPDAFSQSYRRFLTNVIRDELPIGEVPIRLWFRKRITDDKKDEIECDRVT